MATHRTTSRTTSQTTNQATSQSTTQTTTARNLNTLAHAEILERVARTVAIARAQTCLAGAERATALLRSRLSDEEWTSLEERGYLEIGSPAHAGRRYRIPREGGMIRVYERGDFVALLCVQPKHPLPQDDVVLMHIAWIRGDEERYLATANHFVLGKGTWARRRAS